MPHKGQARGGFSYVFCPRFVHVVDISNPLSQERLFMPDSEDLLGRQSVRRRSPSANDIVQGIHRCAGRVDARTPTAHPCRPLNAQLCMLPPNRVSCVPGALPVALASLLDRLDRIDYLELSPNPWEHPPEAFVAGGMQAVRQYFEDIFKGGTTAVTRPLKIVIVGKETVGKTRYVGIICLIVQISSYMHKKRLCGNTPLPYGLPLGFGHQR